MKRKYVIGLDGSGIDETLDGIEQYRQWIVRKTDELSKRLADLGATAASLHFSRAIYNGTNDFEITVEPRGQGVYAVRANGDTVLFVEFGSGLIGYGHPEVGEYGPGTYPGKGHWDDPKGWWYPTDDPGEIRSTNKAGQGYAHSYGNPPNAPMYNTVKELEQEIVRVAKEVFSD